MARLLDHKNNVFRFTPDVHVTYSKHNPSHSNSQSHGVAHRVRTAVAAAHSLDSERQRAALHMDGLFKKTKTNSTLEGAGVRQGLSFEAFQVHCNRFRGDPPESPVRADHFWDPL